jgi:hypothetical protein
MAPGTCILGSAVEYGQTESRKEAKMTTKAAMWVHGTIVEVEYPGNLQSWVRKGWGTHFVGKPGTDNWFHIPITTPVILDDRRLQLVKIFVFYNTDIPAAAAARPYITDVQVFDGPNKVKDFSGLPNLAGKHDVAIDASNSWNVTPSIPVQWGLSLTVHVHFPPTLPPGASCNYEILFTTAGADFTV